MSLEKGLLRCIDHAPKIGPPHAFTVATVPELPNRCDRDAHPSPGLSYGCGADHFKCVAPADAPAPINAPSTGVECSCVAGPSPEVGQSSPSAE
jgi:hypothetical protein